ncbi:hypothetical protein [Candidatus Thiodubiliella endoseptemdiera]|uniref:hypothetical protein n=1 Tax=Candidatus Thiodubiliella endoseptemdiera TaxID=2738886 RepID=UPI0034DF3E4C
MRFKLYVVILFSLFITSCGTIPKDALRLTQKSLELRQIQQKEYNNVTEKHMLIASANVLQDIGFIIKESEQDLGLLIAEKTRDATNTGQVIMAILLGTPMDTHQKIKVSLITRIKNNNSILVRASFQRIVFSDTQYQSGVPTTMEYIKDKKIYQDFYTKLDKAIFLAKQGI